MRMSSDEYRNEQQNGSPSGGQMPGFTLLSRHRRVGLQHATMEMTRRRASCRLTRSGEWCKVTSGRASTTDRKKSQEHMLLAFS